MSALSPPACSVRWTPRATARSSGRSPTSCAKPSTRGDSPRATSCPRETELVEHYGVSRMTVRNSLLRPPGRGPGGLRARQGRLRPAAPPGAAPRLRPVRPPAPRAGEVRVHRGGRRRRQPPRGRQPGGQGGDGPARTSPPGSAVRAARPGPSAPLPPRRAAGRVRHLLPPARPGPRHPDRRTQPRPRRHLRPPRRTGPPPRPLRGGDPRPDALAGRGARRCGSRPACP